MVMGLGILAAETQALLQAFAVVKAGILLPSMGHRAVCSAVHLFVWCAKNADGNCLSVPPDAWGQAPTIGASGRLA